MEQFELFERATLLGDTVARRRYVELVPVPSNADATPLHRALHTALVHQQARAFEKALEVLTDHRRNIERDVNDPLHTHACILYARLLEKQKHGSVGLDVLLTLTSLIEDRRPIERLAFHWSVGVLFLGRRRFPEAMTSLSTAHRIALEQNMDVTAARIYTDIATVTIGTGDAAKAITMYEQALLTLDASDDHMPDRIVIRINLASVYQKAGRDHDALEEYRTLLSLDEVLCEASRALPTELNMAIALKRLHRYDEALEVYRSVEKRAMLAHAVDFRIRALIGIADLLLQQHRNAEARRAAEEALHLAQNQSVHGLLAETQAAHAAVDHADGHRDHAIAELQRAFQFALSISDNTSAMSYGAELVAWLAQEHRFKEAYDVQCQCTTLQRSIYEREIERTVELSDVRSRLDGEREAIRQRDAERNRILHAVLPKNIAERLMDGEKRIADRVPSAAILFADIVGFTRMASEMEPEALIGLLEVLFSKLDEISARNDCERIKTIGDSYMAISVQRDASDAHVERMLHAALEMVDGSSGLPIDAAQLRVGLHVGPVVAGVMSGSRLSYDVWGDTVNVAARMEEHAHPGRVHCTEEVVHAVTGNPRFLVERREPLDVRGKGLMQTFWISLSR